MRKTLNSLFFTLGFLTVFVSLVSCAAPRGTADGPVVLDIGHYIGMGGAQAPRTVNGQRIQEVDWWYRYVYYTKKVIEDAGYEVRVINRGNAPTGEPLRSWAARAGVLHQGKPDRARRYPSRYFPDRVAGGIISADYAIFSKAACAVFLHHNSTGGWRKGASPSIIICNKYNGGRLAGCLAATLNKEVLNHGMPNGGRECTVSVRSVDAERSAGWMNACDDAGIPAAVIEAAFLSNSDHVAYLANDATARHYAESVGRGVVQYLRTYGNEARHYRADPHAPDKGSFGYAAESRSLKVPGALHLWKR